MRVVVAGAGLQGVAAAWFLARRGCAVTVLERASAVALGTSHANAGMLTPSMADPWNAPGVVGHVLGQLGREESAFLLRPSALPSMVGWGLAFMANARPARFRANMEKNLRLALYSLDVLRALTAELGLRYAAQANGSIKVFRDARSLDDARRRNAVLAQLGLEVKLVTPDEVVRIEPSLAPVRDKLAGGVFCPRDGHGDARAFTEALAARAREAGVEFVFDAEITGFAAEGGRVTAAVSRRGRHTGDAFVVALGSGSPLVARSLGLSLAVRPVKGYSITLPLAGWASPPRMPVIDDALHSAATPLGDRLRIAGTAEIAGWDTSLPPARVENLFTLLLNLFPSFAPHLDRAHAVPWAGLRPMSADGVPLIGRLKYENLWLDTGHGHLGWTLAAGSAKVLADLMLGTKPEIDAVPYRPDRKM